MNNAIEVVTLKPQPTLVIRTKVERKDLGARLAELLPRTFQHAMRSGAGAAGMPFVRYLRCDGDSLEIEAGVPVQRAVKGDGDIAASELPGGRVAKLVHVGPYDGLPAANAQLQAWAKGDANGPSWEVYMTDPTTAPPQEWETHVVLPLR